MNRSNKKRLYSILLILVLILSLGATVIYGESKQAKLKKENLRLANEMTESSDRDSSKEEEEDATSSPENISENTTDTEETKLVYSKENINVRSGPGTNYSVLGSLLAYKKVTLIEKGSDGWSKISFNGGEGYCYSIYLLEEEM